jgi:heme-degrading monooxygenase HmoA
MTAFNVVRFRVKPGREQDFLNAHRSAQVDWKGLQKVNMIKTGERAYCIIAEWTDMNDLAAARPSMIATRIWAAASALPIQFPALWCWS